MSGDEAQFCSRVLAVVSVTSSGTAKMTMPLAFMLAQILASRSFMETSASAKLPPLVLIRCCQRYPTPE